MRNPPTRGQVAKRQRERRRQRTFIIAAVVAILMVIAIPLFGYWRSVIAPGREPILRVNTKTFTWNDYIKLLRSEKNGAEATGQTFNPGTAPYQLMQTMAENELIFEAAARQGLNVTQADIDKEEQSRLMPTDSTTQSANPDQLEREYKTRLNNYLTTLRLSKAEYDDIVKADLLRSALRDKLGTTIPNVQPQAHLFSIHLDTADQPNDTIVTTAQDRLKKGEDFAAVAKDLSIDQNSQDKGGDQGWAPKTVYPDFDSLLFGTNVGETSEPIKTDKGYWLAKVAERAGDKAHLLAMLLPDNETANKMVSQLRSGADFATLVKQNSIDAQTKANGGELGLVGVGDLGGVFDRVVGGLPLGRASDPIHTQGGTFIIQVTERASAKEIDDKSREVLKTRALDSWVRNEWDANKVDYCPSGPNSCFSNIKVDRALAQIGDVAQTNYQQGQTATVQAQQQQRQQRQLPVQ